MTYHGWLVHVPSSIAFAGKHPFQGSPLVTPIVNHIRAQPKPLSSSANARTALTATRTAFPGAYWPTVRPNTQQRRICSLSNTHPYPKPASSTHLMSQTCPQPPSPQRYWRLASNHGQIPYSLPQFASFHYPSSPHSTMHYPLALVLAIFSSNSSSLCSRTGSVSSSICSKHEREFAGA